MGLQLCRQQWVNSSSRMKLLVLSCVVVVALGAPDAEPEADPFYGYGYGLGVAAHPFGRSFVGSTVYGYSPFRSFYGKRSADADANADPFYGGYGYRRFGYGGYPYSYGYRRGFYGKRSAEAETATEVSALDKRSAEPHGVIGRVHGLGLGLAGHPGYGTSYVGRTVYGYPSLHYGKRSADADADAHYGAYGYGRYGYRAPYGYGYRRGYFYGKRSADAGPHYGGYGYSYGVPGGYTHVSRPYGYYGYGR